MDKVDKENILNKLEGKAGVWKEVTYEDVGEQIEMYASSKEFKVYGLYKEYLGWGKGKTLKEIKINLFDDDDDEQ